MILVQNDPQIHLLRYLFRLELEVIVRVNKNEIVVT
jgi:hypothetical protein